MTSLPGRRLCLALLLAAAAPCFAAAQGEPGFLESIRVGETAGGAAEIEVVAGGDLDLVGVRADPEGGLSLQLPRHVPGPGVRDLFPEAGLIRAVTSAVEETSRGSLTRIRVRTRQPVSHTLSTDGSLLRLRLWPWGTEPEEVGLRRQIEELEASVGVSERARRELEGRVEKLLIENRGLARRFDSLEDRRRELDTSLKATLGEVTGLLQGFSARTAELNEELEQAASREGELRDRVARLEATLADSERERGALAAQLGEVEEARDALAREARSRDERARELEASLVERRGELEALRRASSTLAEELAQRLAGAEARESELRAQLEALASTLADARRLQREPTVQMGSLPDEELTFLPTELPATAFGRIPLPSELRGTTTEGVNFRRGPGIRFGRFGVLPEGTTVEALAQAGIWIEVKTSDGSEGWVHGDFLRLGSAAAAEGSAEAVSAETVSAETVSAETVSAEVVSPETVSAETSDMPAESEGFEPIGDASDAVASTGGELFIVAATVQDEALALALSSDYRGMGYPSEVYWSTTGYYIVTLDRLTAGAAKRRRDQAVLAGDAPADAYIIFGESFERRVDP